MPELPEVETAKAGIQPYVEGQRVSQLIIRQPRLRWLIPESIQQLENQLIKSVTRKAKYILLETDVGTALIHLGMSGNLRIVNQACEPEKHDHWDMRLANGKILRYRDPRRFGAFLWTNAPIEEHELLIKLGPEPLSDDFNGLHLYERARNRRVTIKEFIMNSHIVVGVGNIYANESLFMAGINPKRQAGKVSLQRYQVLVKSIKTVLTKAIEQGGTTLKDFVREDGQTGYFQVQLQVYGKAGHACPSCQSEIKQVTLGQRSTFYCPVCQK
jgi:formamidopyrimidine-DNA glycosylase